MERMQPGEVRTPHVGAPLGFVRIGCRGCSRPPLLLFRPLCSSLDPHCPSRRLGSSRPLCPSLARADGRLPSRAAACRATRRTA
eukprot:2462079-Prymnesium_polylepis.1